ncbi:MAG: FIG00471280: hypothetical protein [uncultured Sulfurovum sp.]|uniref:Cas10/Cmr2 second palm domain-containing protein n=1 Tax=uncultured Sulfurovum sp. TaxID=269237 RepID=A0A6S6T5E6_9BACT|nr:MAG: FIG00471280: hypothetical protein [uncultured Sulfurovum sp.]
MGKYLYGASVQGIQDFIFKTNKLQEIVGASEIVKGIEKLFIDNYEAEDILLNAAGNIKAVFTEDECRKVVLEFPKRMMQSAYGITLSQAVVEIVGKKPTQDEINLLEQRLKVQRNRVSIPLDLSLNIMALNPSTAKPVVAYRTIQKKSTPVDRATEQKIEANNNFFQKNPHLKEFKNLSEMSNAKNKIAVIHADGNGLGMLIPQLHKQGKKLSEFSKALDLATKSAFEKAKSDDMSIRDVILGGDDMVVICNANDALTFTKNFLLYFEEETEKELGSKLTACAGIAYMNEKYPFHYAIALAEELCSATKKHAKKINESLAPSSLMFHNIQSSNFQSWSKFVDDELTIKNDKQEIRCDFGPYYLDEENEVKIGDFINTLEAYRCDGSPISRLRMWMGELYKSHQYASVMLARINDMAEKSADWKSCIMEKNLQRFNRELSNETLIIKKDGYDKTPIYDVLQILSATEAK